ncbi:MAG: phage head closure protein [Bacteroidota bacterium]|jgi:SPP1 family predicted phage head-tail adaptor
MVIEDYYNQVLELHRVTKVNLGGGSFKDQSAKVKNVKGRLRPLNGSERYIDHQKQKEVNYRLYCGYDSSIDEKDILIDPANDNSFEISFIKNPMQMNQHLEIDLILS